MESYFKISERTVEALPEHKLILIVNLLTNIREANGRQLVQALSCPCFRGADVRFL